MKLYHTTTWPSSEAIVASGFRDEDECPSESTSLSGVWLQTEPLPSNGGHGRDAVVALDLPDELILDYALPKLPPATKTFVYQPSFAIGTRLSSTVP